MTVKDFRVPEVVVVGHTDTMGDRRANLALGLKRATSVRNILVEAGLAPSTIEVTSHGEADLARQDSQQHPGAPQPPCRDHGEVIAPCSRAPRRPRRRLVFLCGVVPVLVTAVLAVFRPTVLARLDDSVYDILLRSARTNAPGRHVVIVDVDERSLSTIGQWPWRRDVVGRSDHAAAGRGRHRRLRSTSSSRNPIAMVSLETPGARRKVDDAGRSAGRSARERPRHPRLRAARSTPARERATRACCIRSASRSCSLPMRRDTTSASFTRPVRCATCRCWPKRPARRVF